MAVLEADEPPATLWTTCSCANTLQNPWWTDYFVPRSPESTIAKERIETKQGLVDDPLLDSGEHR